MKISFNDLHLQYLECKSEIDYAIEELLRKSDYIRGEAVSRFESAFSKAIGSNFAIGCGNGTDALHIAMKMLGVREGCEVIVPAHTWISTAETVSQTCGRVVFADIDPETMTILPSEIEKKITEKTVGIVPVHLYGNSCPLDEILTIASRHELWVVEDCAQAHFTTYKNSNVGTFGIAGTFSFYPGKNLGALGDAGAIVTNDKILENSCRMYASHGGLKKNEHKIEGINSRLDTLQAAVLNIKLSRIFGWTEKRKLLAKRYRDNLSSVNGIRFQKIEKDTDHSYHLFVILCNYRDELKSFLSDNGVETNINYPHSLPFTEAYKYLGHVSADFPNAYHHAETCLSLPLHQFMSIEDVDYCCGLIEDFTKKK